ncbi:MAG: hypothetical protein GX051_02180 [Clostridiales bacterium]|nr:hypothetical protein [Clostridiales bacterium]
MSTAFAIRTVLEIAAVMLVIFGLFNEEKLVRFEHRIKLIIVVNYRRYKRARMLEKQRRNREFVLAVDNGGRVYASRNASHAKRRDGRVA